MICCDAINEGTHASQCCHQGDPFYTALDRTVSRPMGLLMFWEPSRPNASRSCDLPPSISQVDQTLPGHVTYLAICLPPPIPNPWAHYLAGRGTGQPWMTLGDPWFSLKVSLEQSLHALWAVHISDLTLPEYRTCHRRIDSSRAQHNLLTSYVLAFSVSSLVLYSFFGYQLLTVVYGALVFINECIHCSPLLSKSPVWKKGVFSMRD